MQLDPDDVVGNSEADLTSLAQEAMHPAVQEELRRQLADLNELEREGVTADVLRRLRAQGR